MVIKACTEVQNPFTLTFYYDPSFTPGFVVSLNSCVFPSLLTIKRVSVYMYIDVHFCQITKTRVEISVLIIHLERYSSAFLSRGKI